MLDFFSNCATLRLVIPMAPEKNTYQDRIVVDPKILVGKPVVQATRIPVTLILDLLAHGYDFFGAIVLQLEDQTVESVNRGLAHFFHRQAAGIDLDHSLVVL
jgi:hypothetical protein